MWLFTTGCRLALDEGLASPRTRIRLQRSVESFLAQRAVSWIVLEHDGGSATSSFFAKGIQPSAVSRLKLCHHKTLDFLSGPAGADSRVSRQGDFP